MTFKPDSAVGGEGTDDVLYTGGLIIYLPIMTEFVIRKPPVETILYGITPETNVKTRCVLGGPALRATPNALVFDPIPAGQAGASQTITLTNYGTGDLTITALDFPAGGPFSSEDGLPLVIAAGDSETLTIDFDPLTEGDFFGNCSIISDGLIGTGATRLWLQGQALAEIDLGLSSITASLDPLTFPVQNDTDALTATVTITNVGAEILDIPYIISQHADIVPAVGSLAGILPAASTTLGVTLYRAQAGKTYDTSIRFFTNSAANPVFDLPVQSL
jgi:hypothetical protein